MPSVHAVVKGLVREFHDEDLLLQSRIDVLGAVRINKPLERIFFTSL